MDDDNPVDQPEDHSARKPDDASIQKQLNEVLTRIDYMERVMRDQLSRLYQIENRLGLTPDLTNSLQRERQPQSRQPRQLDRVGQPPQPPTASPQAPQNLPPVQQRPFTPPPISQPGAPQPQPPFGGGPVQPQSPGASPPATSGQRGVAPPVQPPFIAPPQQEPARPIGAQQNVPPRPPQAPFTAARSSSPFPQPAKKSVKGSKSLEELIGGTGLMIVGVIAMVFAVAFFLKLAFDRGYITPTFQVLIGAAVGLVFLTLGERLRKKYGSYAYGFSGGGILILYFSIFAAYKRYDEPVINQLTAMLLMCLVTAAAVLLSARYNAYLIALFGFIGGFLTPILLSTGTDNPPGLFGYIALLDAGVLALAFRKQWRSLNYMSFAATVLMSFGWWLTWYNPSKLWTALLFFTLFFMIYALVAVLYNVINRQPTLWLDLALVFVNAVIYFASSYQLLNDAQQNNQYHAYLGAFSVLMAAFYSALGLFSYKRDPEDKLLLFTFLGLTFLFLVLAVPIQFDQQWVTMAWAIQAAVMTWIGLRVKDKPSLYAGFALFFIAVAHWFYIDIPQFAFQGEQTFRPILNARALSCAVLVVSLAAASQFYKRMGEHLTDNERSMFGSIYLLGANVFAITLFSLDANSYFEQKRALARLGADSANLSLDRINNAHLFTLSALWSMYGAAALFIGVMRNVKLIRLSALLLLGLTALKILATDWYFYSATWHVTIFNQTFISFVFLIAALASGAWFYLRAKEIGEGERAIVVPLLIVAANVFALLALSLETLGHYDRVIAAAQDAGLLVDSRYEDTKQFVLSALWTIYASVVLFIGVQRKVRAVRLGALALLGLAVVKVLFVNLFYYDASWHQTIVNQTFASFALLILACAFGVWLYSRSADILDDEFQAVSMSLITTGNLLAVTALSAEVIGHFNRLITTAAQDQMLTNSLEGTKLFILSALWILYAGVLLSLGIKRNSLLLRIGGLLLLAAAVVKLVIADLRFYDAQWHRLIFNETFGAFVLIIAVLGFAIWLYSKNDTIKIEERQGAIYALTIALNVLALVALSAEALGYFAKQLSRPDLVTTDIRDLRLAQQLSLSVIWAVYGGAMLTLGILRRNQLLRIMALLLLSLTILKVFLWDLSSLDKVYRMVSFLVLGLILLAVSMLYQRFRFLFFDEKKEEENQPPPTTSWG
jgi:uncharacterized membrane protein